MSFYLRILLLSLAVPLVLSFWPGLKFYRNLKGLVYSIGIVLFIFGLWDIFSTWRQHWWFNSKKVYELRIVNLPIEEILFFVIIPFCCIFTWEVLNYIKKKIKP